MQAVPLEQGAAWSPELTGFIFVGDGFLAREGEQVDASAQAVW